MELMGFAVASSTSDKRRVSWRHWTAFRREFHTTGSPISPSEIDICLWLTYLYNKGLRASTIRAYMYALSSEIKSRGGTSFIKPLESWFIRATIRAIDRKDDPSKITLRQPLTTDLLAKLADLIDISKGDNFVYITMLYVGVFGLFRINELCYSKVKGSKKFIKFQDVQFFPDHVKITIFNTKTEKKVIKVLGKLERSKDDPYRIFFAFFNSIAEREPEKPVFTTRRGIPVTRQMLVNFLQATMPKVCPEENPLVWNGISLRKGGATSAIRAGVPGEIIQALGSWKSDVYVKYLTTAEKDIIKAQGMFAATK